MGPSPSPSPGNQTTLVTVDIVVLVIYFLLILAVGFWVRTGYSSNTDTVSSWWVIYRKKPCHYSTAQNNLSRKLSSSHITGHIIIIET